MDRNVSSFTVCFQPPFWVGIAERWTADGYEAARVVFGPEPSDAQIYQWLGVEWHKLRFSPAAPGERARVRPENPKRVRREARKTLESSGAGTRAQQALARGGRTAPPGAAAAPPPVGGGAVPSAPAEKARKKEGAVTPRDRRAAGDLPRPSGMKIGEMTYGKFQ